MILSFAYLTFPRTIVYANVHNNSLPHFPAGPPHSEGISAAITAPNSIYNPSDLILIGSYKLITIFKQTIPPQSSSLAVPPLPLSLSFYK